MFSIYSMDSRRRDAFLAWFEGPPLRGDRSRLIERTRYSKGRISQFFDPGQPFGERAAHELARRLGLPADAFDFGPAEAPMSGGATDIGGAQAHAMSHIHAQHAPLLAWGNLMNGALPEMFWAELPDDSMAPRAPRGHRVCFDSRLQPRPGDGVLVADAAGGVHFRLYRAGIAGRWSAAATNAAFDHLESERDGLRIIAVLMAEEGRWA